MTAADRPSPAVLEAWVAKSWDRRPPYTYEALVEMWREEQASRAKAHETDWKTKQLEELRRRVAQLERALGPGGKGLIGDIAKGFGIALAKARQHDRERILAEVEARGFVTYRGTWDEAADYAHGAMVTCAGSTWIAVGPVAKGERPGRGASWRLAAKGEVSKGTVVA